MLERNLALSDDASVVHVEVLVYIANAEPVVDVVLLHSQ